ncbi:MAG: cytochrome c [Candidatus Omnitrophica bacterium]|nr:cytochrome c [Candidatus Omnitrophota bacterium]
MDMRSFLKNSRIVFWEIAFLLVVGWPGFSLAADNAPADKPAELFFYRCAGCHTIGGGKLSGPDLTAATQWSVPDLGIAVKKMEKNAGSLTQIDIDQMVDFLKDPAAAGRITKQKQRIADKLRTELPPPSFSQGQKLFRGQKTLKNGGPACISCHYFVNEGGSLGLDLTTIKDRSSAVVLQSAIESANYKVMKPIYEQRKITLEESLHLAEYLSHPEKVNSRLAPAQEQIVKGAGLGFVVFLALLWLLNRQRKGRTRENLIKRSSK